MNDNEAPRHSALIPKDHAEAMRRFETVRTLDPATMANLEKQELILAWCSFCWLEPALHPDDVRVWPEEVADALPLPAEAFHRCEEGEIEDGEYYPADAVRQRILHESAKGFQPPPQPHQQQQADPSET